ncbi:MAG: DNA-processing protein DprA [Clostridiaceae bacterium]
MNREFYEGINREARLKAAFSLMDYKTRHDWMTKERVDYPSEEMRRIKSLIDENRNYLLIGEENYPKKLYDMNWPPLVIFYEGDLSLLGRPAIGIVGSRNNSLYGERVTKELALSIAKIGGVIVSGGARGVDAIAHGNALLENGKTICILGNGLNISYPKENDSLFREIKGQGLLLSEYPKGYGPKKWTFPMRNKIIAALSDFIIVTEAAEKSGSLHTASYGEEINRRIYAVPSPIFSITGKGTNSLIDMGARILYRKENLLEDILDAFPLALYHRISDLGLVSVPMEKAALLKLFAITKENLDVLITRFEIAKVIEKTKDGRIVFKQFF